MANGEKSSRTDNKHLFLYCYIETDQIELVLLTNYPCMDISNYKYKLTKSILSRPCWYRSINYNTLVRLLLIYNYQLLN